MALNIIVAIILFLLTLKVLLRFDVLNFKSNVDMSGKVVIVTGANAGIGFCIAKELAVRGARVILACRSAARGEAARRRVAAAAAGARVVYKHLDLASLASVRAFCADVLATETRLDVLINNAGVYGFSDRYTEDGIVENMQINHFGHFLLTDLLLPLLKKTQSSRIVNVTSLLLYYGRLNLKHLNEPGYYVDILAYSNSKLCNLAHAVELAKRLEGTGVVVNAVHPGSIKTEISEKAPIENISNLLTYMMYHSLCWLCHRTVEEGAGPVLQACVDPAMGNVSGKFLVDGRQWPIPWWCSDKACLDLWMASEELVSGKIKKM